MRWNILAGVALALAFFGSTAPAAHAQQITQRFLYTEYNFTPASFVEIPGTGTWLNYANNTTYKFSQTKRNNYEVVLLDYSRNLGVILYADGSKVWSVGGLYPWHPLGQGIGTWVP
jgi:hypothetical protein